MDAVQMRDLLEHYRKLRGGLEACKGNIRRIKSARFEEYIEEKTYRNPLSEIRLHSGKPSSPTETLGMYGRKQFEAERDAQLRSQQRTLAARQALLWQLDSLIAQLGEPEKQLIVRRYVHGERIEDVYAALGISRATAFRRLESGITRLAALYRELYEVAA